MRSIIYFLHGVSQYYILSGLFRICQAEGGANQGSGSISLPAGSGVELTIFSDFEPIFNTLNMPLTT